MSLRLEMLQVARLAPKMLGDAAGLVERFFLSQLLKSGGFADRSGQPDLYYTVFGLEGLMALSCDVSHASTRDYLRSFQDGGGMDFVHLCCLARSWATLGSGGPDWKMPGKWREAMAERILGFRSADGGFHPNVRSASGTAYAAFLAVGALQDLGVPLPDPEGQLGSLERLRTVDGAWANEVGIPVGATNSSAAVIAIQRQLGQAGLNPSAADWIQAQVHPMGGFRAMPQAPIPDLLSTATALHALAALEKSIADIQEGCLDFVDTLWTNEGGFHGHWHEDHLDCEYTYYGLLALGHLSL